MLAVLLGPSEVLVIVMVTAVVVAILVRSRGGDPKKSRRKRK